MRSMERKTRSLLFGMVIVAGCLCMPAIAGKDAELKDNAAFTPSPAYGAGERTKLFGLGSTIGYVGQYIWRGIPLTDGPCIQPDFWASLWEVRAGIFMNIFGSNKDQLFGSGRNEIGLRVPDTGYGSQSFGMCNEVKLYLDWNHAFNERFFLYAAYTHQSFAENINARGSKRRYAWFYKTFTNGELTIKPSFKVGFFTVFTEQDLVVIAKKYTRYTTLGDTVTDNRLGDYYGAYGVTYDKKISDEFSLATTFSEEMASNGFLSKRVTDLAMSGPIHTAGFYLSAINVKTVYRPVPWFSFSANYGFEVLTNKKVSNNAVPELKGALVFGGVHTTFSW